MAGDGEYKATAKIQAPHNKYTLNSAYAQVKGKLYIFGGQYGTEDNNYKKVYSLFSFQK